MDLRSIFKWTANTRLISSTTSICLNTSSGLLRKSRYDSHTRDEVRNASKLFPSAKLMPRSLGRETMERELVKSDCKMTDIEKAVKSTENKNHICRQHRHRISSQGKKAERVVFKSGQFNLEKPKKFKYRVLPDIVAAFVEARWRWTLLFCIFTYIFVWLLFTAIWWFILYAHGDFEPDHLPHSSNLTDWTPCVKEIYGFTSIFLFSIEIHTTIGYGTRTITLQCPSAMLTMCLESILGTITQSFIVGIVFAKLTRPKNRAQTLLFSKNAIINQRNKNLCFMFRIGDTRKSRIISVSVHAFLIRCVTAKSKLGEQILLKLSVDSSDTISFVFPLTAVHVIDETSPLYSLSAKDILKSELEILVVFEGTIESTGQPVQGKSSYTAQEILWGQRFSPMVDFSKSKQGFVVDYQKLDETYRINTPLCSASKLKHLYEIN